MIAIIKSSEVNYLTETSTLPESLSSSTDVNFFNSAMAPPSRPNLRVSLPSTPSLLSEAVGKLSTVTDRMTKSLRALSSPNKLEEARKYPGQLSDALLLQQMLSKSVGKTAQCIDKISSLQ